MPFNINELNAQFNKKPPIKASHFVMSIVPPPALSSYDTRPMQFRILASELPGRIVQRADYRDYGIMYRIGFDAFYQPLNFTILCSGDFDERKFFQDWQTLIVGDHKDNYNSPRKFNAGYYDDYKSEGISIVQYSETGKPVYKQTLVDAWPETVNQQSVSWDQDQYLTLNVLLSFRFYRDNEPLSNVPDIGQGQQTDIFKNITNTAVPFGEQIARQQLTEKLSPASAGLSAIPTINNVIR